MVEIDGEAVCEIKPSVCVSLREGLVYFVNPGSVDASRQRTAKRAEFSIFDSDALTVRFEDVAYDDAVTGGKKRLAPATASIAGATVFTTMQRRIVGPRHAGERRAVIRSAHGVQICL